MTSAPLEDAVDGQTPGPAGALGGGVSRVLAETAAAVLLIDLATRQVVYVNELAAQLAPGLPLPADVADWSAKAGLRDADGTDIEDTATPLARIAAGQPVAGELVTAARSSDMSARREDLWVIGTLLTDAPQTLNQHALVVFLPLRDEQAVRDLQHAGAELRHRAVIASDLSFSISDPHAEDDPLVWVNPAFERATGYSAADAVGRNCRFLQGPLTDRAAVDRIRDGLEHGGTITETLLNYRADGTAFWNHLVISPIYDAAGQLTHHVGVQSDVTDRVEADQARDAALHTARQAIARQRAVAAVSRALSEHVAAPQDVLIHLARAVADHFTGWVAVVELDDQQPAVLRLSAAHGLDPVQDGDETPDAGRAADAMRTYLDGPGARLITEARDPRATWPRQIALSKEDYERATGHDGTTGIWNRPDNRSLLALPIRAHGRTFGLLIISRLGDGQFDDENEVDALRDIAMRAGAAADNARLYAVEHHTALTLQRSLLPVVPTVAGVDIAAFYSPASSEVGGDWYDVLDLDGPWLGVAVGDVIGHDITAAAAMGQIRAMLRALAWDGTSPADVLRNLDRLVRATRTTTFATLFYGVIDRPTPANSALTLHYANAGHPPPLLRHADGHVEQLTAARSAPVGVKLRAPLQQAQVVLEPGSALLLYTDGLVETRDTDLFEQTARLADTLAATTFATAADLITEVRRSHLDTRPPTEHQDDTCILAIHLPS